MSHINRAAHVAFFCWGRLCRIWPWKKQENINVWFYKIAAIGKSWVFFLQGLKTTQGTKNSLWHFRNNLSYHHLSIHIVLLHLMSLYSSALMDRRCGQSAFQHPSELYTCFWQLVLPFAIVCSAFFYLLVRTSKAGSTKTVGHLFQAAT